MKKIYIISYILFFIFATIATAPAQTQEELEQLLEIEARLQQFLDEWNSAASIIQYARCENAPELDERLQHLDAKWNTYYQAQQMDIAADDSLLEIVGSIQVAKQNAEQLLEQKKSELQMLQDFRNAELTLPQMEDTYAHMASTAEKLAMAKQLQPKLEKLKAREQLTFAGIQANYDAAKAAAEAMPQLSERMKKIEEHYIAIKNTSEKIQSAAYQPLIQRIKDYLLSFAAVAVILMFVNMISSKVKSIKQAKEAAKKLQQFLPENQQQYPTI